MPTTITKGMEDQQWEHLLDSLEEQQCIICIGPEVYASQSTRYEEQLASFLREKADKTGIRVYDNAWFHYLPNASEIDAWQRVKEFYAQDCAEQVQEQLSMISQLPFHFLINFTPGYELKEAFDAQKLAYNFLSYEKKQPFDPKLEANQFAPTKSKPLIFNMLGEVKKRNSLVMTYNDFYSFMESTFEGNSMSPVLKEKIFEADYFVFLGMPFDRWYVHMFMRILQQHEQNKSSKKYAANVFLDDEITTLCAEQYTMSFVSDGITDFLNTFFEKAKARNILRTAEKATQLQLPFEQIENWLRKNDFEQIFDVLIIRLGDIGAVGDQWKKEIVQMEGRYNDLKRKIRMGVIDERDLIVETNRIRVNVLDAVQGMKKQFGDNE